MKFPKFYAIVISLIPYSLFTCFSPFQIEEAPRKFEIVFEKSVSVEYSESGLNFYPKRFNRTKNYISIYNELFGDQGAYYPILFGVHNNNFYVSNAHDNIIVYDNLGNEVHKYIYKEGYNYTYPSFDDKGNLYLFLVSDDGEEKYEKAVSINADTKENLELDKNQINLLDSAILPIDIHSSFQSDNRFNKHKGDGENYFDVKWGKSNKSIFSANNGQYIVPETVSLYKFSNTFEYSKSTSTDLETSKIEEIIISNFNNNRFILLTGFRIDKEGNMYLSGVRSNDLTKRKIKIINIEKNVVDVKDITFFIWKFSNE